MVAPKETKQAVTRKAHEVVADQIRQQIVEGVLVEGQRLPPEDDLTVQFGVARTTLREALRVLESQGLLEIRRQLAQMHDAADLSALGAAIDVAAAAADRADGASFGLAAVEVHEVLVE